MEVLKNFETVEERIANDIKEMTAAKKTVSNKKKNLKTYIAIAMEQNGQDKIQGKKYSFTLSKSNSAESLVFKSDVESDQILMGEFIDTELVDVNYSWNKEAVKAAVKKNPEVYSDMFEMKERGTRSLRKGVITE